MADSIFAAFRKMQEINKTNVARQGIDFISTSKSSRVVSHDDRGVDITAVLTNTHKEGGDEFIMFTENLENTENNVLVGDYITSEGKTYLVYGEYNHPNRKLYIKNRLIECNQDMYYEDESQPVYYMSSLRSYLSEKSSGSGVNIMLSSGATPMIITSDNEDFKVGNRFKIVGEVFKITQIDRMSNSGIAYLSVKPASAMTLDTEETTYNNEEAASPTDLTVEEIDENIIKIFVGEEITIDTFEGYVDSNKPIEIINRTSSEITWKAPLVETEIEIITKDNLGQLKTAIYKVVM